MASFDPSIISQIPDFSGNPLEARSRGFKLADLITEQQRNKLLLGEQKQQLEEQNKAKDIFKSADISSNEGRVALAQKLSQAGLPKQSMEALQFSAEQQTRDLQQKELRLRALDLSSNVIGPAALQVKQVLQSQGLPAAQQLYSQLKSTIPQEFQQNLPPQLPNDPQQAMGMLDQAVSISTRARQMLDEQRKERETSVKERGEAEREREDRARDDRAIRAQEKSAQGKAPPGFEWDPDKQDTLRPIPGGPKDPNSKPWTGREKVFGERIITAANEAARAISNITELPVGASTGVLGVGKSPGHSLYESGRDVLRNKVSSQEVQDYNSMLAGVRRNMATIESTGLAPPGSLTESMSSIELREGDTQTTKLRKLAEMRQIADAGIEVQLADPAIPDSIKDVARKALDTIHKAVPFTHHDITQLQASPDKTLQQLIKEKGLGSGSNAPAVGTVVKGYRFKGGDPADKANWEKSGG